ncbi:MAG: glycosyltransferase family 4 protein [Anaerolineales bacterium]|jgi:glycosyltransferase involved in cell wall biosynthesis
MHILLIHQAFAVIGEAGGTRHHEFARHMQARGHQVSVIAGQLSYLTGATADARDGDASSVDDLGVEIIRCASYGGWHTSFVLRVVNFVSFMWTSFWSALRIKQVDLVWGTTPPIFQALTASWVARIKRVPFLLEVRDLWPYFAIEVGVLSNPILIGLSEWLERFLYRRASVVIVNSPGFVDHVRTRGADLIYVVPNGADPDLISAEATKAGLRSNLGIDEDTFVVLYAGAHGMSNDLGVVLRAAESLPAEADVVFVLMGAGKDKAELQSRAQAQGLKKVYFHPPVPKDEIAGYLVEGDAGLAVLKDIPAYSLTYPNKVFDYMAAGLPVLCMIDGVIRKVVEDAAAGVFVQPGDPSALSEAVLDWSSKGAELKAMGQRGRDFVKERFDRGMLADQMLELMLSTMDGLLGERPKDDDPHSEGAG